MGLVSSNNEKEVWGKVRNKEKDGDRSIERNERTLK